MKKINTKTDKEERQRLEQHLKYVAGMALLGGYDTVSNLIVTLDHRLIPK
jgi:hypothetical protein